METPGINGTNGNADFNLSRSDFPMDFSFGAASSAYQYEGAAMEGERGPSIWDTFTQRTPDKVKDGSNGNMAVDSYHLYKEDVKTLKKLGLGAYRFSISWSRVLPGGKLSAGVNKEGIKYYNDLINELVGNGIEPFVTLFHWDLPQALEDEYGGFLSSQIVDDFREYAQLCFWEFGDRVKNWITLNEPWSYSFLGYVMGLLAPGRGAKLSNDGVIGTLGPLRFSSSWQQKINDGDPGTEPYTVSHNQLLAHAAVVELYRQNFQISQDRKIGISLVSSWMEPLDDKNQKDNDAANRALDFMFGWFMDPLANGDYPETMKNIVKSRLPRFSEEESKKLKGSYDFLGLNYYTGDYVTDATTKLLDLMDEKQSYITDRGVELQPERDGTPIGPKTSSEWIYLYPEGLEKLLVLVKEKYNNPLIYITENGVDEPNNPKLTLSEACKDTCRKEYLQGHLLKLKEAIANEVQVKGYFVWSLLDNFEWNQGYTVRFGMMYVDYNNYFARYPKDSAIWLRNFLEKESPQQSAKRRIEENQEKNAAKKMRI